MANEDINQQKNGPIPAVNGPPAVDQVNAELQKPAEPMQESVGTSVTSHPTYYSKIVVTPEYRLDFVRAPGAPPPASYRELRKQIEDVARLVRTLFQNDTERLNRFFGQLHVTGDSGLRGPESDIDIGSDNLQEVKNSIADEFPAIRGKIWWWNFGLLVGAILVCGVASATYRYFMGSWVPVPVVGSVWPAIQFAVFFIPLGVILGLFLEFIFRVNDDILYEGLRAINPGRWKPFQRFFNTTIVGYVFAGILGIGAFQVGVASVLLNDFVDKRPELSLAIGFVTGLAFPYVRDLVQQFRPIRRDTAG